MRGSWSHGEGKMMLQLVARRLSDDTAKRSGSELCAICKSQSSRNRQIFRLQPKKLGTLLTPLLQHVLSQPVPISCTALHSIHPIQLPLIQSRQSTFYFFSLSLFPWSPGKPSHVVTWICLKIFNFIMFLKMLCEM